MPLLQASSYSSFHANIVKKLSDKKLETLNQTVLWQQSHRQANYLTSLVNQQVSQCPPKETFKSKLSEFDRDISTFVDSNSHAPNKHYNLPELMGRDQFLGKWFQGGRGETDIEQELDKEPEIDYDLKNNDDQEGQTSDFEEWWGVEREGKKESSDSNSSDDDDDGGEMMPIFEPIFKRPAPEA